MQVQNIMTTNIKSCRLDTNLSVATAVLWSTDCGALPVLDANGKVVGMITDRDICIAAGTRNWIPSEIRVFEVVPQTVYTCTADEDIHSALQTMKTHQVRRLPVVDPSGSLCGMLSLNDVVLNVQKSDSLSYEDVIETLKGISQKRITREALAA